MQRWRDSVFRARRINTQLGSSGSEQWFGCHFYLFFLERANAVFDNVCCVITEQISCLLSQLKYWYVKCYKTSRGAGRGAAAVTGGASAATKRWRWQKRKRGSRYVSSKLIGICKYEFRIISWLLSKGGQRSPYFQNASQSDGQEGPCMSLKNSASCLVGHPGCAGWRHIYPPFPFPSTSLHLNKKSNSIFQIFSRLLFLGGKHCWIMQPDRDLPELVPIAGIAE